jgi:uncharacterized lipoprotein YmbA
MKWGLWQSRWLVPMALLAGCAVPPDPRSYVLGDPPEPLPLATNQSGRPVIRLLPVSVPDYLDTRDILLRSGQNEVTASPTGRWAERLSVGVTHALAAALSVRLPGTDIVADQLDVPPERRIMVDVQAFEIRPDRQCLLSVQWIVASSDGDRVLSRERASFVEQATDTSDAAVAAAMSRAIARLAAQIVTQT